MDAKEPLGKDSFIATSDQFVKCGKDGARYMESWGIPLSLITRLRML